MQSGCILILSLLALAGCVTEPVAKERMAATSNSACSTVAAARTRDAAINGYNLQMQEAVWNEVLDSCLFWSVKSSLVDAFHH